MDKKGQFSELKDIILKVLIVIVIVGALILAYYYLMTRGLALFHFNPY